MLLANSIMKLSPNYYGVLQYYLIGVLKFTAMDFSLKNLTAELFIFFGIISLNTIFKNTERGRFIKATGVFYVLVTLGLIPLLYVIEVYPQMGGLIGILVFTGFHALFYEIFYLPIMGIFLDICPENLEGFFMSMILLLNNFSRDIGSFLGVLCIYLLSITSKNYSNIYFLIFLNAAVNAIGVGILFFSLIPEKLKKKNGEEIAQLENNYLAYINTTDSLFIEETPAKPSENGNKNLMISIQPKEFVQLKSESLSIN